MWWTTLHHSPKYPSKCLKYTHFLTDTHTYTYNTHTPAHTHARIYTHHFFVNLSIKVSDNRNPKISPIPVSHHGYTICVTLDNKVVLLYCKSRVSLSKLIVKGLIYKSSATMGIEDKNWYWNVQHNLSTNLYSMNKTYFFFFFF